MKKPLVLLLAAVMVIAFGSLSGCTRVTDMIEGHWLLSGVTDSTGNMSGVEFSIDYYIYKDGNVDMWENHYGTYSIDRSNFTFTHRDGDPVYTGSFDVNQTELYIYLDDRNTTVYLTRVQE